MINHSARRAFTLVELSVVLAILGLMVGSIIAGKSMLDSSRLRQIISDTKAFSIAVKQFKLKYSYLPGDFPTATAIWGRADGDSNVDANCAAPNTTESVGKTTCNGDGDGIINAASMAETNNQELYRAWQQMAAADLIVGKFSGVSKITPSKALSIIGYNVPGGPLTKSGYSFWSFGIVDDTADAALFVGNYNNALVFGKETSAAFGISNLPILGGDAAYEIDMKTDDGTPGNGYIRSYKQGAGSSPNCVVGTSAATATYDVSTSTQICTLLFLSETIAQ